MGVDPRGIYKDAVAGVDGAWKKRSEEYFLDIADDGYVIASGPELEESEVAPLREACVAGAWLACRATDCLGECVASGCSCTRSRNPGARDGFLRAVVKHVAEAAQEVDGEVAYASLGSGYLRFDFCLLEMLLQAGVRVAAVHLVDSMYEPDSKGHDSHRMALAQFAAWFSSRNVDIYAHGSLEKFAIRARRSEVLPIAVLQVDCSELTFVFDTVVKPILEEVLRYKGLFCALSAREGASGVGSVASTDAWGEVWQLVEGTGRLRLIGKMRYRPGEQPEDLDLAAPLPPVISH